jgi:hypothetical protein
VLHYITKVQHLTRGRLIKQDNWSDWTSLEFIQLDQYEAQGMFGEPCIVTSEEAVFNLVWRYMIKDVDKQKKAQCTCNGSPQSGQVQILDYTYANCVDQISARIFYAVTVKENLIKVGADISNAFAEAPPPKQGFYIHPDKAFCNWWVHHKKHNPIPLGAVIPVLLAMQGHPESPRLLEKHADCILRKIGLFSTMHEPCLYSGIINGQGVLFLRQVDDFTIACSDESTANRLLDMLYDELTIPLKQLGLLDLYNDLDVIQTWDYIKINCSAYLDKISIKHLSTWMKNFDVPTGRPTPLPGRESFIITFLSATGDPDHALQDKLAEKIGFGYRLGIG